jgi:NADH dehydrogenase
MVGFTGGTHTGATIMSAAGRHLKPCILELGGKSASIVHPSADLARALDGADAAANLVGILFETGSQRFSALQAEGAGAVAEAVAKAGIRRFVHLSAIGADRESPSLYARSKAEGEARVLAAIPAAVILRPSIVFGPEDQFFNRFAELSQFLPALPLIGGGHTRFQPVFVGDVAEAAARGLEGSLKPGIYELGGPKVATFKTLLQDILAMTGRRRLLLPLPFALARLQARVMERLPNPMLTVDQVTLLARDNVVSEEAMREGRTLEGIGITPVDYHARVPGYLARFRVHGQFAKPTPR